MDNSAQNPVTTAVPAPVQPPISAADDLTQITKDPLPSFADEIKQFDSQHPQTSPHDNPDYQVMYNEGGRFKEQLESMASSWIHKEKSTPHDRQPLQIEEVHTNVEIEPLEDVSAYMEKIEKAAELQTNITDDYTDKILLAPSANQNPVITLPLTEEQVTSGLHHKAWEAVTWLANWCVRQIKLLPGRVKYKQ